MLSAIDRLAEILTGDPAYFHADPTYRSGANSIASKIAREEGRAPRQA